MHPLEIASKEQREQPAPEGQSGWLILMALVAATILVVALVMSFSGEVSNGTPEAPVPSEEPVDPAR